MCYDDDFSRPLPPAATIPNSPYPFDNILLCVYMRFFYVHCLYSLYSLYSYIIRAYIYFFFTYCVPIVTYLHNRVYNTW